MFSFASVAVCVMLSLRVRGCSLLRVVVGCLSFVGRLCCLLLGASVVVVVLCLLSLLIVAVCCCCLMLTLL